MPVTNPNATWKPIARHGTRSQPMRPRLIIVHTNAAGVQASLQANWNVANAGGGATQPHFVVAMDGTAWQFLETSETGVASYLADDFAILIETQDQGYPTPGDIPWTPPQLDTIARIEAEECKRWGIPAMKADRWDGSGLGWHSMWGINTVNSPSSAWARANIGTRQYPNPWTKYAGKTCPGAARIAQMPTLIARVRDLVTPPKPPPATQTPTPDGGKMLYLFQGPDGKVWLTDHLAKRDVTALQTFYVDGVALGGLALGKPKPAGQAFLDTIPTAA